VSALDSQPAESATLPVHRSMPRRIHKVMAMVGCAVFSGLALYGIGLALYGLGVLIAALVS
jgi:hypothetical protein